MLPDATCVLGQFSSPKRARKTNLGSADMTEDVLHHRRDPITLLAPSVAVVQKPFLQADAAK